MTSRPIIIAPSILAADLGRIEHEAERIKSSGAEWVHIDIMDGHFVPNISFGVNMVRTLRKAMGEATLDVHLMIEQPDRYARDFIEAGADFLKVPSGGPPPSCPHSIHDSRDGLPSWSGH